MTKTPDIWMLHTTNPREGESQWGGCYIVEADAHNDAATMRKVTGLDWEVVPMVRADSLGECLHQIAEPAASVEKQIDEVMELVLGWQIKSDIAGDAAIDAFDPECSAEDDAFANKCHEEQLEAWEAIRTKLRTLLSSAQSGEQAAPQAVQAAVPATNHSETPNSSTIIVPYGWKLVPDDATPEWVTNLEALPDWREAVGECIKRFLAAAPAHPAEGVPAPVSLIADARRLAYVADQVRALEPEGSESDVYLAEAADVLRACADRIEFIAATHPTQQGLDAQTQAARSVLAERARQISAEGYTPEQDDGYNPGVLALHGGLYACHAYDNLTKKRAPEGWQWDAKWWKPKDPRSTLVKACALVLAEIERIDRTYAAQAKQGGV